MIDLPSQAGRASSLQVEPGGTSTRRSLLPAAYLIGVGLWTGSGTERGIEQRLVPAAGIPLHHLSVSGMRGKSLLARGLGVFRLLR